MVYLILVASFLNHQVPLIESTYPDMAACTLAQNELKLEYPMHPVLCIDNATIPDDEYLLIPYTMKEIRDATQ